MLDKNGATKGQVLTGNGTGGASWEAATGGTQLYKHICFLNAMSGKNDLSLIGEKSMFGYPIQIISTRSAKYNGCDDIISDYSTHSIISCTFLNPISTGSYYDYSKTYPGFFITSPSYLRICFIYCDGTNFSIKNANITSDSGETELNDPYAPIKL